MPARLVVLASGEGTTLQGLLEATRDAAFGAEVVAVGSDREPCKALDRAAAAGLPSFVVRLGDFAQRSEFDDALAKEIAAHDPELVVLAGYMKILGPTVVRRFRILNTHPALLPAYPGAHAVRDALADGATVTGATVHWVDEGVDTGPVIAQVEVPVLAGDDEHALHARIKAVEGPLFVDTVGRLARHEL